jgi:aspartate racemase
MDRVERSKPSPPDYRRHEPIVGVLGLAPYATIDFLRKLSDEVHALKDWHHIRSIVDMNCKIPSRGRAIELGEEEPTAYMRAAIVELQRAGAAFVVIPCNTAHCYYDAVVDGLDMPVLSIIEATAASVAAARPAISTIGLMASRSTVRFGLYERAFAPHDIAVLALADLQDSLSNIIERVKVGQDGAETRAMAVGCAEKLLNAGAQGIILGCTELPLVLDAGEIDVPLFDSNRILAQAVIARVRPQGGGPW